MSVLTVPHHVLVVEVPPLQIVKKRTRRHVVQSAPPLDKVLIHPYLQHVLLPLHQSEQEHDITLQHVHSGDGLQHPKLSEDTVWPVLRDVVR